jgi:hypothetical protein
LRAVVGRVFPGIAALQRKVAGDLQTGQIESGTTGKTNPGKVNISWTRDPSFRGVRLPQDSFQFLRIRDGRLALIIVTNKHSRFSGSRKFVLPLPKIRWIGRGLFQVRMSYYFIGQILSPEDLLKAG